tara:strand:+ start:8812 stop:9213 length:402 start_codon:yes stop_codon:yes gene_type:complete
MLNTTKKNEDINTISKGTNLKGDLVSSGDIRIDGTLSGSINTKGRLVVGETGSVEGQIKCQNAVIAGKLQATINTEELLMLKSSARLSGEVVTGKLAIEPGAIFTGKCSMGPIIKNLDKNHEKNLNQESEKSA